MTRPREHRVDPEFSSQERRRHVASPFGGVITRVRAGWRLTAIAAPSGRSSSADPRRDMRRRAIGLATVMIASLALPAAAGANEGSAVRPCTDWPVAVSTTRANAGGPDTQAAYWVLGYSTVPGGRLRIHGEFPKARYFSLTVQDQNEITLGSLRDNKLWPDPPTANPFQSKAKWSPKDTYTAYIDFAATPASGPAPNTFYAGRTLDGAPNSSGTVILRIYVPTDQQDPQAGVPLPTVTLQLPGADVPLSFGSCQSLPPDTGGSTNRAVSSTSQPSVTPRVQSPDRSYGPKPAFARVFAAQFDEPVINALPSPINEQVPRQKGMQLSNADFPYLISYDSRHYGDVVAVRFKSPTFPDTVRGVSVVGHFDVRYWSMCTFSAVEEGGIRTYGCLPDFMARHTNHGYIYVVASDAAHRPAHAMSNRRDVYWLPFGPSSENNIFYRMGIPAPWWQHSPMLIRQAANHQAAEARRVMGDFYPDAVYCSPATIQHRGISACFMHRTRTA
jgi:hypothetical protein